MIFETKLEILIKQTHPIDVERLAEAISIAIKPIIEHRSWQGAITQTVTAIISHNLPKA